ncbi:MULTISPECIES: ribonuclease E/G [unclassified Caulobacter]|uniref:Rne/Rng family ribonuclease n=1 Tax=unclassified Caulobacter TaxID=2648921 RepID=UPI0006F44888|nr:MULTISPECIES: ribonuclease E/G [unclassified Caulobacter]KQV57182.1 ribonuclease E [Caulobacter sp. Root342]KQV66754.1 ribonuclease E [Caulobacter sp. Root343]
MSKKMLIDAAHAEETRVVVVDGTRVEEFDFESQTRKQLRGNIYLAKVTRVEPSLQAAFIEYGGNRHGFLAFNEIHPDYYQIPVADREALMRDDSGDDEDDTPVSRRASGGDDEDDVNGGGHAVDDDDDDVEEELARRKRRLMRKYKIQEVIRRRQIMLVQVVKEERGNKGAALTTYLSLAGRYGVLMPNTARGGGISRKITAVTDRKRLKGVVQSLDVPQGMGLIVRTAGAKRTKAEIKRDYEYLLRLWENIRENTLHSIAPALIYEEEDLVKRAIRDMYDKDLDGIWVEGDAGYKEARDFMRMLMPSQAKKVFNYRDPTPLFVKHKIEDHLAQIYSPVVPLRSGGYLVINQTEALVAIDVNSGKATRERNIEATALKTNMEAAEEAARQLRLRDLAGLIVIDFIDMDEGKNNRAVEKVLKDSLKDDRARIQMGKISGFGLMEISRQRRRTGVLEGTTHVCEHCEGTGRVRSVESSALAALRAVEAEALKGSGAVILKVARSVGLYILNEKRAYLQRLQQTHGLHITVLVDDSLHAGDQEIERTELGERIAVAPPPYVEEDDFDPTAFVDEEEDDEEIDLEDEDDIEREDTDDDDASSRKQAREDDRGDRKGRRRRDRGRSRGRREEPEAEAGAEVEADEDEVEGDAEDRAEFGDEDEDARRRRRRRGRRGGRRGGREDGDRPADAFVWIRPRVPFGENVFTWHDPAALVGGNSEPRRPAPEARAEAPEAAERPERVERPEREDRPARERGRRGRDRGRRGDRAEVAAVEAAPVEVMSPEAPAEPFEAPILAPPIISGPPADVWVELPEAEEAPKKAKRPRARGKKAAAADAAETAEAVAEVVTETVAVAPPEPEEVPVVAAAPEPVPAPEPVVAEAAPAAPAEPDPNEITTPPEKPRKGWWRR